MDGFKNIEIKNFRGIDHLKIDDFSRVNVFLGQNSSGRSSVLECHQMLAEHPEYQDEMWLYTIENTLKKGYHAHKFTYEGMSGACGNDVELRN